MNVIEAIKTRASTRAFLDRKIDKLILENILEAAKWAPSSTNSQPWHVGVVTGEHLNELSDALLQAVESGQKPNPDYPHYPSEWKEPYKSRRFKCGMALYSALDIKREDKHKRMQVWHENYRSFGAPCNILFFIDAHLEQASWFDCGMFFENVMLAAREYGLESCAQASLAEYPDIVRQHLGDSYTGKKLICGLALGYADKTAKINSYRTERESLAEFCQWFD